MGARRRGVERQKALAKEFSNLRLKSTAETNLAASLRQGGDPVSQLREVDCGLEQRLDRLLIKPLKDPRVGARP